MNPNRRRPPGPKSDKPIGVEGTKGAPTSRAGVLLLTLAMLAAVAALLHMLAWW